MNLPPPPGSAGPPAIPAPPEASAPKTPSRVPLVVGLLVFVGLLVGGGLVWRWASTPAPCASAELTSERFGYCISVPTGWRVAEVAGDAPSADQLFRPDGDATVMIQAVEAGHGLDAFARDVRRLQRGEGLSPAATHPTQVDGVDAREWDATLSSGSQTIRARTIVFERDGVAWRVQFADTDAAFDGHVAGLSAMLASWRFR